MSIAIPHSTTATHAKKSQIYKLLSEPMATATVTESGPGPESDEGTIQLTGSASQTRCLQQGMPQTRALIQDLFATVLDPTHGCTQETASELEQSRNKLHNEKHNYFQHKILYDAAMQQASKQEATDRKSTGAIGCPKRKQSFRDFHHLLTTLQASRCVAKTAESPISEPGLFGLSSAQILSHVDTKAHQRIVRNAKAYVWPEIERCIYQHMATVASADVDIDLDHQECHEDDQLKQHHRVARRVGGARQRLRELNVEIFEAYRNQQQLHLLQVLKDQLEVLVGILQHDKLVLQLEHDHVTKKWMQEQLKTWRWKLLRFKQVVKTDTYDKHSVKALYKIRHHLEAEMKKCSVHVESASLKLQQYERIGDDMKPLVQEYQDILTKIKKIQKQLNMLNVDDEQMQRELQGLCI
jgi:HAUS augmin-like complex subunit 4